jgi:protein-tyrosine phosphatase
MPRQLEECDLLAAAHIVAVKENEHRPMLARRFPHWVDRVEYWRVDDIEDCHPDDALALLEFEVSRLLLRISNDPGDLQSSDR